MADQWLRHLARPAIGGARSDVYIPYPVFADYRDPAYRQATCPAGSGVDRRQFDLSWEELNAAWDSSTVNRHRFLGSPDVVHANNFSCPDRLEAPIVYTIYDLSPLDCPEFHTEQNRIVCLNGLWDASLRASHFVAISGYSRDRFLHWFPHVSPDRVSVIALAARTSVSAAPHSNRDAVVLREAGLTSEAFWLAVGTIEPRKNYRLLLEVMARLRDEHRFTVPLCIVGQQGWLESSLAPQIRALDLDSLVRCLGFVPDDTLAALYRHALALLYPSHYEGFGLPVIEAMAAGAVVLAQRTTSLPAVVGDGGAVLMTPGAEDEWVRTMVRVAGDKHYRQELREAARAHGTRSSWTDSAAQLREVYDRVALRRAGS